MERDQDLWSGGEATAGCATHQTLSTWIQQCSVYSKFKLYFLELSVILFLEHFWSTID